MHRLFLVLMIFLLPLRGWMGNAMATEMAAATQTAAMQQSAEVTLEESHAHEPGTASHSHAVVSAAPDCADHVGASHSSSDNSHCISCVVCQACNAVGMAFPADVSAALHAAPEKSACTVARFTSADRALSLKPPIS